MVMVTAELKVLAQHKFRHSRERAGEGAFPGVPAGQAVTSASTGAPFLGTEQ
jgi:hypothetical protein